MQNSGLLVHSGGNFGQYVNLVWGPGLFDSVQNHLHLQNLSSSTETSDLKKAKPKLHSGGLLRQLLETAHWPFTAPDRNLI